VLRTLLVGLDGSDASTPAIDLGLRWAKTHQALLAAIAIVDDPGVLAPQAALIAEDYRMVAPSARLLTGISRRYAESLRRFADRCGEARVACRTIEAGGTPHVEIAREAQRYDLVLLGRHSHFELGWQGAPGETLAKVLKDSPRPVVAVPEEPADGEAVVVAYDGTPPAARALYAFEASGLGRSRSVHVVSVADNKGTAEDTARHAVEFLHFHEVDAVARPLESRHAPADAVLDEVRRTGAGLLVMGAFGQTRLREFLFGSTTRAALEHSPAPVFLFH
jgi:nucleotide-binding universal stress UspA family protein